MAWKVVDQDFLGWKSRSASSGNYVCGASFLIPLFYLPDNNILTLLSSFQSLSRVRLFATP